jgi:hypothetical protein
VFIGREDDIDAISPQIEIEQTLMHLKGILEALEQDYPELTLESRLPTNELSGRAIRTLRKPVETRVFQRRVNYDNGLVRANAMALAIGGFRRYEGYSGFNLDSYANGDLDHKIANRPVFEKDVMDDLEQNKIFWDTAVMATSSGMPLAAYLKSAGWTDEQITEVTNSEEYQARIGAMRLLNE